MMMKNNGVISRPFSTTYYPWIICIVGMLFYCFNYFLRVSPSVIQDNLIQAFHIKACEFGALAACYYWAYTPMQLPAGMIYDKYGARAVLSIACLTAVIGLAIFATADTYFVAAMGRLLIGFGTAFAYIGVLKLASLWLPANRFATVAGFTNAIGMISGALSQKYLTKAVEYYGYQQALNFALIIGVTLSIFIFLIIRSRPKVLLHADFIPAPLNTKQLFAALKVIATNKQMWIIGFIGCLLYLPASVFLDVWGIPYLKSVYQLTAEQAVGITSATFMGWIISGPIIGGLSDKFKRRRLPLVVTGALAAILLCIVFYLPGGVSFGLLPLIFFSIGFCCGSHPLCFALGKENNPLQISGTAVAVTNMLIMAGGAVFQPVVGLLLDLHTTSPLGANGLPVYAPADYTFALSVVPIGVAIGLVLSFFLKETHCQVVVKEPAEKLAEVQNISLQPTR